MPSTNSNPNKKAFVLLSGGLDSTTALFQAIVDYAPIDNKEDTLKRIQHNLANPGDDPISWVEAVSINYGQRHKKEMQYARTTCERLGIEHRVIQLPENSITDNNTMLANEDIEVPNISYSEIQGVSPTYVPFRNGTMLSLLTAHAQKWVNEQTKGWDEQLYLRMLADGAMSSDLKKPSAGVYFGAHAEDAHNWAYPDCTPEFIGAMSNAIYIGSYQQIRLHAPLMNMQKSDIVTLGEKLGVPFENTWSCYKGERFHCGICPTCRSRKDAFSAAEVADPTVYADQKNAYIDA